MFKFLKRMFSKTEDQNLLETPTGRQRAKEMLKEARGNLDAANSNIEKAEAMWENLRRELKKNTDQIDKLLGSATQNQTQLKEYEKILIELQSLKKDSPTYEQDRVRLTAKWEQLKNEQAK